MQNIILKRLLFPIWTENLRNLEIILTNEVEVGIQKLQNFVKGKEEYHKNVDVSNVYGDSIF